MLSLIIPTYKERENIEELFRRIESIESQLGEELELLIVDSDSPDGTSDLARNLLNEHLTGGAPRDEPVAPKSTPRVGRHPAHPLVEANQLGRWPKAEARWRGGAPRPEAVARWRARVIDSQSRDLTRAILEGVGSAQGNLIGVMDADLSHPPELLPGLVRSIREGYPLAIASRYVQGSQIVHWPLKRRLLSYLASRFARVLVSGITDPMSGYFVCQAEHLRKLSVQSCGFKILLELLVRMDVARVREIPYVFIDRRQGTSKLRALVLGRAIAQWVRLFGYRLRHSYRRSPSPAPNPESKAVRYHGNTSQRQTLSVVILTKNEESRIARCLASVQWADEVIIVDGMSTDGTVEICRQFGARVITHPFEGSFAQERNLGLEHATSDWALQLDADDVVTPAFHRAVERILTEPSSHDAYKFRRKSHLLGRFMRYGGWYHYLPNLVRTRAVRYEGRVHERPIVQGSLGQLDADIEHHPCENLAHFMDRHNRYTTLSAQELLSTLGHQDPKRIIPKIIRRPWKSFWKTFVRKQAFREGLHGLVFSLFFAGVELIKWVKYWELCTDRSASSEPSHFLESTGLNALKKQSADGQHCERLSVVLMTKNEEARLKSCLDRVVHWADEIVVVDDLSTDRTVEIARIYTDKVFLYPCENNHDRQWNRGIQHATGDWILHIDADEWVGSQLRAAIDLILTRPQPYAAFEIMRKNHFLGHPMRQGGWYHRHRVLFRRTRARCIGNGIHVQLQVDGPVGFLNAEIEHFPFSSISQFIERQNRYTSVEAQGLLAERGSLAMRHLYYQLTVRPVKLFWKSYVKNQGYREGAYGLVFGLLYSFVHILRWAKYWELTQSREVSLKEVRPMNPETTAAQGVYA